MQVNEPRLVVNRWMAPDGTILHSKHRHDFITYYDAEGRYYMLDGGIEGYTRVSGDLVSLCLYEDDEHSEIRKYFVWRTYGRYGDEPPKWVVLKDMTTEHLENILGTQYHISGTVVEVVFRNELKYREDNGLSDLSDLE